MLQHCIKMLVLVNRRVRDTLVLVEDGVRQRDTLLAELQAAIRKGIAVDVFAHGATRDLVLLQNDPLPLKGERQH